MSRIGRKPITVPAGVEIKLDGQHLTVKGPKTSLEMDIHPDMIVKVDGDVITVERPDDQKEHRALHGLTRSLINNMVIGVTDGFEKKLEIKGVGYKAVKSGKKVTFSLGYSHTIDYEEVEGITIELPDQNTVIVKGADKQLVGETAAKIRSFRVPDVYKGKGIKYADEHLIVKEGKTGAKK